ncbi:hypothetical protein JWG41_03910 [Leptospira sp. 201903075]|uniref:hypothetical protein n=1 Tax=Leptospira chreensis TaxID=2810035 RepID=UPI00196642CF|nr:hypothetical protein [Leptospira chreensis]MBM9589575.1 hypothetical protein [Leptospira chreensis]
MKKIFLVTIQLLFIIHCVDLNDNNDLREENKMLRRGSSLLLLANQILNDYNSALPMNNMLFRYSVIDSQNIGLSLSQYCVNVYTVVGLDPNKIITEWHSLTKYPDKCALNYSKDFKCISSNIIYINEYILPASLGLANARSLCSNEVNGTILVY